MSSCIIKPEQIISLKCDWGCDITIFKLVILLYVYTQTYYKVPQKDYKRRYIYNNISNSRKIFIKYFSEFGYLGLKYILDKNGIYYAKYHPVLIREL